MLEVARVDRDRLCPAEAYQQHHQRADGVDVAERVKRQPAARLYALIAQTGSGEGVRPLVKGQDKEYDRQNRHDFGEDLLHRKIS